MSRKRTADEGNGREGTDEENGREGTADHAAGWTRRTVLGGIGTGTALALGAMGSTAGGAATGEPWRIVALPDTQAYASNAIDAGQRHMEPARAQTRWIDENAEAQNIVFVTHEGDIVWQGWNTEEFELMDEVMSSLDGVVPYGVVLGDHEYHIQQIRSSGAPTFKDYFGASRYEDNDWFGGAGPENRNFYQTFDAGGYAFLNLSLEYEVPGEPDDPATPVGWAQGVIDDHPDRAIILTTHAYLSDGVEGRTTTNGELLGVGNTGQELWEKLVRPNDQVFMVLNGNYHGRGGGPFGLQGSPDDGEYHQVSTNDAGSRVFEMLANYQTRENGGNGWLRILSFVPGGGADGQDRIDVETYSPYLDEYQTGDRSDFHFDLDFDERLTGFEAASDDSGSDGWGNWGSGGDGGSDNGGSDDSGWGGWGDAGAGTDGDGTTDGSGDSAGNGDAQDWWS